MAHKKAKTTGTGGGKSRYMTRTEAKDGARVRRRREDGASEAVVVGEEVGYHDCGCRDCFEIAVGVAGTFCHACVDAGCEPDRECCAPGAYGVGEEE